MKTLISDLATNGKKIAYQSYVLKHGIEHIQLLVPVKNSDVFQKQFEDLTDKKKANIVALVESLGGKVKV